MQGCRPNLGDRVTYKVFKKGGAKLSEWISYVKTKEIVYLLMKVCPSMLGLSTQHHYALLSNRSRLIYVSFTILTNFCN